MTDVVDQLRQENIRLRQQANYYKSLYTRTAAKLDTAHKTITALKQKVAEWVRRYFARGSEKSKGKGKDGQSSGSTPPPEKRPRGQQPGQPGHGRQKRPDLPEREVVVDLPGGAPVCPECGQPYCSNGTVHSHEEIVVEVNIFKRVVRRRQYKKGCSCSKPGLPARVVAPPPARVIPRGLLSVESIVEGLLNKFKYFMPLQRMVAQWRELGVDISPGTWCGTFQQVGPLFEPLMEALLEACRTDRQWLMDETRWPVFVRMEGKGSFRWWLWVAVSRRVKYHILSPSRGSGVPKEFFGYDEEKEQCQWTGSLMVDRFSSYKFLATLLKLAFCWTHVRRDFVEAQAGADAPQVAWAQGWIDRIGGLYELNGKRLELGQDTQEPKLPAPFVRMDPERMAQAQYQQADGALRQAVAAFQGQWEGELAQEKLPIRQRKILESLKAHWSGLTLFVDNPEIPMDNNGAERVIRGGAIARNNFYGSGSVWSGELLAMMLTILQTAQMHQVNLRRYLIDYLLACANNGGQAPKDLTPWLPWNYKPKETSGP